MRTYDDAGSGTRTGHRCDRQEECLDRPREPLPTRVEGLPDLPPAFDAALDRGLAELGLHLERAARNAIEDHARLLFAWNAAMNLTAIRDPAAVAVRHVVDSLAAIGVLRERRVDELVDIGSGGGYPGLPLAAALPARRALLVESIGKKAAFLATVVEAVGLASHVSVHAGRAEDLASDSRDPGRWSCVTARAVATLADLVELSFPLLRVGGCLVAWKRGDITAELAAAERAVSALGGGGIEVREVPVSGLDGHRLVVVTKHDPTHPGMPREPAARRRAPW